MSETPYFFSNSICQLYGVLYEPDPAIKKNTGYIFIHPFAEEMLWTQRVMVTFARELVRCGYPVLRFDFMGHGDSEGNFVDATVKTRLSDISVH